MDKAKIGIIGLGYVGKAFHRLFENQVVAVYDPNIVGKTVKSVFNKANLSIACIPTPTSDDGLSCDTSILEGTIKWLKEVNPNILVLIKSTTPPSEAQKLKDKYKTRLVFSPEYIGEGGYFVPFWKYPDPKEVKYHTFQIFGGDKKDTSECVDIFIRRVGSHVHFYQTDIKTACLTKYLENAWLAMKVTFCNEWYEIAKAHGVNYNELRELWLADTRVGRSHTAVYPSKRGYGGKCLPKDVRAVIADTKKKGYRTEIMETVDRVNKKFNKK